MPFIFGNVWSCVRHDDATLWNGTHLCHLVWEEDDYHLSCWFWGIIVYLWSRRSVDYTVTCNRRLQPTCVESVAGRLAAVTYAAPLRAIAHYRLWSSWVLPFLHFVQLKLSDGP
eukprot:1813250-Amphidinium_carterae.1